jgi:hypothetical protein
MTLEFGAASKTWGREEVQEGLMRKGKWWKKKGEKRESEEVRKEGEGQIVSMQAA